MDFSQFGRKFTRHAGITQLMDDLNQGLLDPNAIMLGGGNPAAIPAMLEAFQTEARHQLASGELLKSMINFDGPQGKGQYTAAPAALAHLDAAARGRGLPPERAANLLKFSDKKAAALIKKVVESAIANAENNQGADVDELKIVTIMVDEGPSLERFMARAKGRGTRILKRTSHITVVVGAGK